MIYANQLSICGAVADLCDEVPKGIRAPGKPAAPDHLEKMEIPNDLSVAENSTNAQQRRNFEQLSEDQKLSKSSSVWSLSNNDNTSILLKQKKDNRCNIYAENTRCLKMEKGLV